MLLPLLLSAFCAMPVGVMAAAASATNNNLLHENGFLNNIISVDER